MEKIMFTLFFFSSITLAIGLVSPNSLRGIFKRKKMDRKFVLKTLGTATAVLLVLAVVIPSPPAGISGGTNRQDEAAPAAPEEAIGEKPVEEEPEEEPQATEPAVDKDDVPAKADDIDPAEREPENMAGEEPETAESDDEIFYAVTKVVDGDTIKVDMGGIIETLRLIGLDTPETVDPRKPVECFGLEASNRAKELLAGNKVRLEADPTQGERDKYDRLLRYVWMEDGTLYNKKMIADGYASEYTYDTPYKYQAEFKQAEAEARNAKRGLWADGACLPDEDEQAGQPAPGTAAVLPSPGHSFYVSSHYSSKYYYCDTDEAWKGLSERYLKEYDSEQDLLADYPAHTLHEPCE